MAHKEPHMPFSDPPVLVSHLGSSTLNTHFFQNAAQLVTLKDSLACWWYPLSKCRQQKSIG